MSSLPSKTWSIQFRELASSPITIIAMTCVLGYVVYMKTRRQHGTYDDEDYEAAGLIKKRITPLKGLRLTRMELAKYGSQNEDGIYLVALKDVIYDVSMSMDFGPGGKYCKMAGTELTLFTERLAYWDGRDEESVFYEWKMKLDDFFNVAGHLIDGEVKSDEKKVEDEKKHLGDRPETEKDKDEDSEEDDENPSEDENFKNLDTIPEEKLHEAGDTIILDSENPNADAANLEIEIPELSLKDLPPLDEGINSDCDSLRTAYDCLPGQDDRNEETDDTEDDYCEANQGDNDPEDTEDNPATDEDSHAAEAQATINTDISWNDSDATLVATR
ncbi:uncharacterized protein Dana_GF14012 [Drosophila ananassae]|uniref:Cytochrome b5 heme-binding domain-containing protein n=1 Tax=Drosophila ananassae TaxID=7217 RepID=B3MKD4_DROAN|nr:prostatic spermine-binding protein [Drosophila ananassae]EDV32518.1 uncharacterized protein Dana_GF14012 [Drosophila ananassae]